MMYVPVRSSLMIKFRCLNNPELALSTLEIMLVNFSDRISVRTVLVSKLGFHYSLCNVQEQQAV